MIIKSEPIPLISQGEIASNVKRLAQEIRQDYLDKCPVLICILKGSFMFLADLIRHLDIPLEVDFIRLSSYQSNTNSSGKIKLIHDIPSCLQGRHVLVVEDIIDTGLTTAFLMDYLQKKSPASLKLCTLMDKPSRRRTHVTIDYTGFTIPGKFVIGYGVDWDEKYRNLPDIRYIEV